MEDDDKKFIIDVSITYYWLSCLGPLILAILFSSFDFGYPV
jgi:hypothetical protein